MLFRDLVGEAIPEIEGSGAHALSPYSIGMGDAPRCGRSDRHKLKAEPVDDARHLGADVSSRGDDEGFGHGAGRDQNIVLDLERRDTGFRLRLVEDDRHQCGRVDRDHPGKPSSP